MNLFGCKFCEKSEDSNSDCDRKNFDSLLWAIVTVFQVLLLNWTISVLYLELYFSRWNLAIYLLKLYDLKDIFLGFGLPHFANFHFATAKALFTLSKSLLAEQGWHLIWTLEQITGGLKRQILIIKCIIQLFNIDIH